MRDDLLAELGLPEGVQVVLGAGDGPLGNLGVGALEPGVVGLSLGTSGAVRMVTDHPHVDAAGKLFCYHLADDAWVIGGAISNGGIVVRWGGDVFGWISPPSPVAIRTGCCLIWPATFRSGRTGWLLCRS